MNKNNLPNRRFFVVIHTLVNGAAHGINHVVKQSTIAKENGADGVILIPDYEKGQKKMATPYDQLLYIGVLKSKFPDFLIGVNFLKHSSSIATELHSVPGPDLIQTDRSSVSKLDKEKLPETEFFCGAAFKYSMFEKLRGELLKAHCHEVADIADVLTTSGTATGVSADIGKIKEIRSYLPEGKRLGIASGVTIENAKTYLEEGVTDFLVATSLLDHVDENDFDILNPEKVLELSELIHSYNS
jgi:hypothetical protein